MKKYPKKFLKLAESITNKRAIKHNPNAALLIAWQLFFA
jgi:hypothetical protein